MASDRFASPERRSSSPVPMPARHPRRRAQLGTLALLLALAATAIQGSPLRPDPDQAAAAVDRLPDLRMRQNEQFRIEVTGGRRLLRFDAVMYNVGSGPLEVVGSRPNTSQAKMTSRQRIYDDAGGSRLVPSAATMRYAGDGHDHWHVQQIMSYDIWSADATRRVSAKVGFCFFDTRAWNLALPRAPQAGVYQQSGCGVSTSLSIRTGISVGWADAYPRSFVGQWIDITGLPAGSYTVRSQVDAVNHYLELNENNNCTWATVSIPSSGTTVGVTQGGTASCPQPPVPIPVQRLAGADRFATAVAISKARHAPGVPLAYIASGLSFPDALAGGPAAAVQRAPVLLVTRTTIPAVTQQELARLRPGRIRVLGGTGVISDAVAHATAASQTGGGVNRLAGADRYATAARISEVTYTATGGTVFIASGETFPDALAAAAEAGRRGVPLLLARRDVLPAPTTTEIGRLAPTAITVVGGSGVISDAVLAQLRSAAPGATIRRLAGANRYATAANVSLDSHPGGAPVVYIATGTDFPDALAGGPAAARQGAPILLVTPTSVPDETAAELRRLNPGSIVILGGVGVVSDLVREEIQRQARR